MMPTSTLRWREISAAAAPMCGFARRSNRRLPDASREGHAMTISQTVSGDVSRRAVRAGRGAAGSLLVFPCPVRGVNEPVQPPDVTDGKFAPNAFIRIDTAGKTTLVMPQVEMGQGIYTAVAMILAEELDADFSSVVLEHAPANEKLYANPIFGIQATGGSTSVRAFWKPLREAGATARAMLVQAAAQQWRGDPASRTNANGGGL